MVFVEVKEKQNDLWKPTNKGDSLTGEYTRNIPRTDQFSTRYFIKDESGKEWMVWGTAVLEGKMASVLVGQTVRITFDGETKNAKKQKLNLFTVEVDKIEIETVK